MFGLADRAVPHKGGVTSVACPLTLCCLDLAAAPQRKFDKQYGPTWHCIVGSDFKAFVSHESKHFIFFYIGKSAILLYKCG